MSKWEQEIDSILASVDQAMVEAEALAKSDKANGGDPNAAPAGGAPKAPADTKQSPDPMKKDGMAEKPEEKKPEDAGAPAADPAAAAPAADGAPSDAPAPEAGAPAGGEQALEQESPEAPISDDELREIYGSMPPEELQRHFMTIREILRGGAAEAPAPAAAAPAAAAPQAGGEPMAMSEKNNVSKAEFDAVKAKNEELEKALGRLTTVMEATLMKPERKAVTDIAYIQKSEGDNQEKQFTKAEIKAACNEKCKDRSLSKSDREALNDYLLREGSSDKVMQIIKGGK